VTSRVSSSAAGLSDGACRDLTQRKKPRGRMHHGATTTAALILALPIR
jgi:hypothetical protein